jgi:ribonuclease Z
MRKCRSVILTLFTTLILSSLFTAQSALAALYTVKKPQPSVLTDGKMHIYFCGTGNPEVGMQTIRRPACLAVIVNNQFMLFDAGEGAIQTLATMGLPYTSIRNIFITHWHSDHIAGVGQVINASWNSGRAQPIYVYGPSGVMQVMGGLQQAYQFDAKYRASNSNGRLNMQLAFGVPHLIDATKNSQVVYNDQGLKITAFNVDHPPAYPALGYRIDYQGCKVVISGDTKMTDGLAANATNADILINEAHSQPLHQLALQKATASGDKLSLALARETMNYHTDTLELAKMAQQTKVKRLVLTHLVPAIPTTPAAKASFIAGMQDYYKKPIIVAADGDEVVIEKGKDNTCKIRFIPAPQPNIRVEKLF